MDTQDQETFDRAVTVRLPRYDDRVGEALDGRYELRRRLCRGRMSAVYEALDRRLDRLVAVKVAGDGPQDVERLRREGMFLSKLAHPRIPRVFDAGEDDDGYWIVLEFIHGRTLDPDRAPGTVFLPTEAARIGAEALEALAAVHEASIVHRDVKGSNLMLAAHGAVLIDFGIALSLPRRRARRLTDPGQAIGTPTHMAPEQCQGIQDVDGRVDLYALGHVLYRLLTGRRAFKDGGSIDIMRAQMACRPEPFATAASGIPQRLEDAVLKALEKDPDDRFRTAEEMREALLAAVP